MAGEPPKKGGGTLVLPTDEHGNLLAPDGSPLPAASPAPAPTPREWKKGLREAKKDADQWESAGPGWSFSELHPAYRPPPKEPAPHAGETAPPAPPAEPAIPIEVAEPVALEDAETNVRQVDRAEIAKLKEEAARDASYDDAPTDLETLSAETIAKMKRGEL